MLAAFAGFSSRRGVAPRALVVGCGQSGVAAAELLVSGGVEVELYDLRSEVAGLPARLEGCVRHFGAAMVDDAVLASLDLLVLSPGVPPQPWLDAHQRMAPRAQLHGELSLALWLIARLGPPMPKTLLITGTNGKSTVTALTGALLEAGGLDPFVGGNLGVPLCQFLLDVVEGRRGRPGALVLECSSYQLETLRIAPEAPPTAVAMILNITPDHIDRYPSMDAYARTKARAFAGLDAAGLALLSANDPYTPMLAELVPSAATLRLVEGDAAPRLLGDVLELSDDERFDREQVPLAGRHNLVNSLFALAAARHLGVSHEACVAGLRGFRALPHRMNLIGDRRGVRFYDDSKATNVASVLAGLDGFERPFVLICGGRAKGDDLSMLRGPLAAQGRGVVAIGESAEQFVAMAEGVVPAVRAADMHEALRLAASMAGPGDAVLLSPACASWDMYRSFVHRGQVFAEAFAALGD